MYNRRFGGNPKRIQSAYKKPPHNDQRLRLGENQVECMRCAAWVRNTQIKKEWTGLIVCTFCWEPRQPQDFVKGIVEDIVPLIVNDKSFVVASDGTITTVPGLATAGTMLPNTGQTMYLPASLGVYMGSGFPG